jgi:hypothetical protein
MEGNCLPADSELLCNGIHIAGLPGNHIDDSPAGGVGDGLVYISSGFHIVQVYACKYNASTHLHKIFWQIFSGHIGFPSSGRLWI